jgi:radical SAM superfamily enzyme YgiQ (UPF0313 family)
MRKKRILLILPKEDSCAESLVKVKSLPFQLLCLGTYLVNKGHQVKLIDLHSDKLKITKELVDEYDFFGFSVLSIQVGEALSLSRQIKRIDLRKPIIWGGVHPSLYPEQCLSEKSIDYIVIGEGEKALLDIIGGKTKRGIVRAKEFIDMDELSPPKWHMLDIKRYMGNYGLAGDRKFITLHTGRGCPFRCTFCINTVISQRYRGISTKQILNEIKLLRERHGIEHFRMIDDNFFADKKRTKEIVNALKGTNITWDASCRADYFNDNYLGKNYLPINELRESGCVALLLGLESGSQRILNLLCKGTTVEQNVHAAKECAKNNIVCVASYMSGLPGETKEDLIKTLDQICYLTKACKGKISIQGPHPYRPYPGSLLYNQVRRYVHEPKTIDEWAKRGTFSGFMPTESMKWVKNPELLKRIDFYGKNVPFPIFPVSKKILIFRWFSRMRFKHHFFNLPFEMLFFRKRNFKNLIKIIRGFFIIA